MKMKKFMVAALATAMTLGSVMTASAAWVQEGMNWKYQNDNGTYQTNGWFQDATNRWFHFDAAGNMQRGWYQDVDGKWYFLNFDGVMQVGLLKVDNNVYFMDEHGALFIGDRTINGTTYNFGLYGTTNGKPNVPAANTYGGNGNQALSGGGSSSGSTITTPSPVTPEEVIKDVEKKADEINKKQDAAVVKVNPPKDNKVTVEIKAKADLDLTEGSKDQEELKAVVTESVESVLANADNSEANISIPVGTETKSITIGSASEVEKYIDSTYYDLYKDKKVTVEVMVNGEPVVYTITLN